MRMNFNANDVADKAQDLYKASRKMARKGTSEANSFINEKPLLSVALGFGAGYLLSWVFRSRD